MNNEDKLVTILWVVPLVITAIILVYEVIIHFDQVVREAGWFFLCVIVIFVFVFLFGGKR